MPCYNEIHTIETIVQKVLHAEVPLHRELIIVDDCSTDETQELCAKLENIRYVRLESNGGLANGRNVGIAESSSEFIAFLDDDDLRLLGSLDKQLRVLYANPSAALCYGQALLADARRQLPTGEIYPITCPNLQWDLPGCRSNPLRVNSFYAPARSASE